MTRKVRNTVIAMILGMAFCVTGGFSLRAQAAEGGGLLIATRQENVTLITDMAGLRAMEQDPTGSYQLATDIDASGETWFPFSFHGTLDGNGLLSGFFKFSVDFFVGKV